MGRKSKGKHAKPHVDKRGYESTPRTNTLLEKFYREQPIIPEAEWDAFISTMRSGLPHAFRLTGFKCEAEKLKRIMVDRYFSKIEPSTDDSCTIEVPKELPWYPDGLGYQMNLARQAVRKSPVLTNLHNFLVTETEQGNVSRQEAVSMIPPLLLDVTSKSRVLDMCASPGSKTSQLLEMIHNMESPGAIPEGFVMANDVDNKRCYLLVHQSLKRIPSPCCLITNHDATCLPSIILPDPKDETKTKQLKFDRILCDVPCSGDGTLRKNIDLWKTWNPHHAYNLHRLQVRIAQKGLELLDDDGIMVYSTCSLNPAEDEAVVVELLKDAKGSVELVDVSDRLIGLKRLPGIYSWKVMDKDGVFYSGAADVPQSRSTQIPSTIFPPTEVEAKLLKLERCFRILPHVQDTGGFFVAVLRKKKQISSALADCSLIAPDIPADSKRETMEGFRGPPRKKTKFFGYKEDPFVFLTQEDDIWKSMKNHFDLPDSFNPANLVGRSGFKGADKKTLYFVNDLVRDILAHNSSNFKIINAGVKMFAKTDKNDQAYKIRLVQDGLSFMLPFLHKRVWTVTKADMITVLKTETLCSLSSLSPESTKELESIGEGSIACTCPVDGSLAVSLCVWLGKVTVAPYVSREARVHFLRLLDFDTTEIEQQMQKARKLKSVAGATPLESADSLSEKELKPEVEPQESFD